MFLCVSPNPAIDKRLTVASLAPGHVMRARSVQPFPGGKSTHVAMVLRALGETPHWIGPCGGATGMALVNGLGALGIQAHPSETQQLTRTNLEIIEDNGTVTEIREPGTAPSKQEIEDFEEMCRDLFAQGRDKMSAIFSGSLPDGATADLYAFLIGRAHEYGCRTFVDTGGEPLRLALAARPHFVKPNRDEASALLGEAIDSTCSAAKAVGKLLALGARSAALSLGAGGLWFAASADAPLLFAPALAMQPRSTVGCGDSALAGFAQGITANLAPEDTLRLAAACAAANCIADSPGAARAADIERFGAQIEVRTPATSA